MAPIDPNSRKLMHAAVLTGPKSFRLEEVTIPEPKENEVRVRLQGCGVCASNLANWEGMPWTRYPSDPGAMGHEGWGTIDAIGSQVRGLQVGDRVATLANRSYAEYDVAPADAVVKIPDSLRGKPVPGEALGCAMNIFNRSAVRAGDTVAIVGIGFLGALLTRLATNAGAHVIAITRRPFALELARMMGARELVPMDDHHRVIEKVKTLTNGRFCNVVIEAAGKQWPLDLAGELTAERGRLVIAGYHQDGPRQVNLQLWNWRGLDVVNAHERDPQIYLQGIRAAFDLITNGKLDPSPLYTHPFRLERIGDALNATLERPDGFMKALVTYE